MAPPEDGDYSAWENGFRLTDDETLAGALARYDEVAARTDALVATVDLDHAWPLPPAPWFEPGATRSARRVFVHIVGETAQHAGHADIIREAIDGKKSMGVEARRQGASHLNTGAFAPQPPGERPWPEVEVRGRSRPSLETSWVGVAVEGRGGFEAQAPGRLRTSTTGYAPSHLNHRGPRLRTSTTG